jgi:hypothetical protein
MNSLDNPSLEKKVETLIESGIFAEDIVTCSDDFINGAYTVLMYFRNNTPNTNMELQADIRNKLQPLQTLVDLVESKADYEWLTDQLYMSHKSIKYIANVVIDHTEIHKK